LISNVGISRLITLLSNDLQYVSIGTGAAPTLSDTVLAGENIRKLATTTIDENTIIKELFLDTGEGNGVTFKNAGTFCNGATATKGTGQLFAGGGLNITKTSLQSLTVSIEITVEEV
jgi:hypothetical protein